MAFRASIAFRAVLRNVQKTKEKTLKTYTYLPTYLTLDSPVPVYSILQIHSIMLFVIYMTSPNKIAGFTIIQVKR